MGFGHGAAWPRVWPARESGLLSRRAAVHVPGAPSRQLRPHGGAAPRPSCM